MVVFNARVLSGESEDSLNNLHAKILVNLGLVHAPQIAMPSREDLASSGIHSTPPNPPDDTK